ncbi:hypothetical protein NDU88_005299 [Pleurodeles waltl]|uniref:Uncharacterized protein n=1 Tax=Pleurodeles waltl TaxID=8319 RepID=A0AAV7QIK7_PLEWA|nr:hypothetical protein NDU88_005299 [Pleurodeles waltl]
MAGGDCRVDGLLSWSRLAEMKHMGLGPAWCEVDEALMRRDGCEIGRCPPLAASKHSELPHVGTPYVPLGGRGHTAHRVLAWVSRGPLPTSFQTTHRALQLQQIKPGTQSSRNALHGSEG